MYVKFALGQILRGQGNGGTESVRFTKKHVYYKEGCLQRGIPDLHSGTSSHVLKINNVRGDQTHVLANNIPLLG